MLLDDITPLILTRNEAPNIGRTLEGVRWASDVVVLDSLSDDETLAIAETFRNVRIFHRAFDSHAEQWNFGLHETGITTEWVLALDADYVVSGRFMGELKSLNPGPNLAGYRAAFSYCVFGKPLRGSVYPPVTVLFRRDRANYFQDGHTQRIQVKGGICDLRERIFHDDRKTLSAWLAAQDRYMALESAYLRARRWGDLGKADRLRCLYVVVPLLMPFYCLLVKRGILDGKEGLYYALQRTVAEVILSLRLLESDISSCNRAHGSRSTKSGVARQ